MAFASTRVDFAIVNDALSYIQDEIDKTDVDVLMENCKIKFSPIDFIAARQILTDAIQFANYVKSENISPQDVLHDIIRTLSEARFLPKFVNSGIGQTIPPTFALYDDVDKLHEEISKLKMEVSELKQEVAEMRSAADDQAVPEFQDWRLRQEDMGPTCRLRRGVKKAKEPRHVREDLSGSSGHSSGPEPCFPLCWRSQCGREVAASPAVARKKKGGRKNTLFRSFRA